MEVKDWLLLFVPVLCNGLLIFVLQKNFEKKQIAKNIKNEYLSVLRINIDKSLETYAMATRLSNEKNLDIEIVKLFISNVQDVYYYYFQNKNIFEPLDDNVAHIAELLGKLSHDDPIKYSCILKEVYDSLLKLKGQCIEFSV